MPFTNQELWSELKPYQQKRLYLIKHAIYKIYTENKHDQVSIYTLANMLLRLFQIPMALAFYKKNDRGVYKRIFHSLKDPRYQEEFEKKINSIEKEQSNNMRDYLHTFLGGKYGLVMYEILSKPNESKPHEKQILFIEIYHYASDKNENTEKSTKEEKDLRSKLMTLLWDGVLNCGYADTLYLPKHLERVLPAKDKGSQVHPIKKGEFNIDGDEIQSYLEDMEDVVDIAFQRSYDTPLLSANHKFPSNILFFLRYYRPNTLKKRYKDKYGYNLIIILGKSQEAQLRSTLTLIKEHGKSGQGEEGKQWDLPLTHFKLDTETNRYTNDFYDWSNTNDPPRETNDEIPDQQLRKLFWDTLDGEDGVDKIITAIKAPFGDNARSFADPVLSSSMLHFKPDPFSEGGLDRIDGEGDSSDNDRLRVAAVYYLLSAMAPPTREPEEKLELLLMPVRVAGSAQVCMCTTTSREPPEADKEEEDKGWDYFFHFASSIWRNTTQTIRVESERVFLDRISEIFYSSIYDSTDKDRKNISLTKAINEANKHLLEICTVFPYNKISLAVLNQDGAKANNQFIFGKGKVIEFSILSNPFFEAHNNYIATEKVKGALLTAHAHLNQRLQ